MIPAEVYKEFLIWLNCLQCLADLSTGYHINVAAGSSWNVYKDILL